MVWAALAMATLACLAWIVFALLLWRVYVKLAPSVQPLLAMFGPVEASGPPPDASTLSATHQGPSDFGLSDPNQEVGK